MGNLFNVLQSSPHDVKRTQHAPSLSLEPGIVHWVPSRYNIRATTDDGRLVLWNSYSGKMSVFSSRQRPSLESLLSRKGFESRAEGIVKYLLDRGYLVKAGTDEYQRIQLGFGQQHYRTDVLQLILLASEDCNFRCTYCYEDFARGTMLPSVREGIKNMVKTRLPSLRNLSISWFGGEPLYGIDAVRDLAPFFLKTAKENDLRYVSNMTTNGYLLTQDVAQQLLDWEVRHYQITIDGAPEDHNQSRPARTGDGTFSTIFENLKAMSQLDEEYFIDVRVNFDNKNYPRLDTLLDLMEKEFCNDSRYRLRFRAVGQWGGNGDAELDVCGVEDKERIQLEMKTEARKRGLSLSDDIRSVKGLGAQVCYAARPYNFIVGSTGKLMKCTVDLDMKDRNVVGVLKEDGNMEIDRDKFAMWTEPAFEKDSKCQKCVVLPTCQGTFCPQIRFDHNTSPCSPLRMGAKKELLETAREMEERALARKVAVTPQAAAEGDQSQVADA